MSFFFSCHLWHKPTYYFKGASNQFSFANILKKKYQLSISDNSDESGAPAFSFTIFQKSSKTLILLVSSKFFSKIWCDGECLWFVFWSQNTIENIWAILFAKPMQGWNIFLQVNIKFKKKQKSNITMGSREQ